MTVLVHDRKRAVDDRRFMVYLNQVQFAFYTAQLAIETVCDKGFEIQCRILYL